MPDVSADPRKETNWSFPKVEMTVGGEDGRSNHGTDWSDWSDW